MKFSTILTSVFFVLFIFTTTSVSATNITNTPNEKIQTFNKVDNIIHIVGRTAQVTDREADRQPAGYTISVKVMQGMNVLAEATENVGTVTMDLSSLDSGSYVFVIQTPTGFERRLVRLE